MSQPTKAQQTDYVDSCQTPGCENEPTVDDYGIIVCDSCLTPEIEAYLRQQAAKDAAKE